MAIVLDKLPPEVVVAAQECRIAYTNKDGGLLARYPLIGYEPKDCFGAMLSGVEDGSFILTFRGTIVSSVTSWLQDVQQAFNLDTSQYDQAIELSKKLKQLGAELLLVGHSLGGGLAACASYATGLRAVTFNAAGLSPRYKNGTPGSITNYFIPGDILTTIQQATSLPDAAGEQVAFNPPDLPESPIARHGIDNFLRTV